ncbi:MAG: hypothetical protein ABGX04_00690 [Myxococcales bacterium]|nr:hypothetical protein [Myxococcales bacterium]HIL80397.1 hypothetical protein [Myxococcales bacterium]
MMGTVLGVAALLLVVGTLRLWGQRIKQVQIPTDRRGFVAGWAGGAVLGIIALTQDPGWAGAIPATLAALGGSFLSVLVFVSPQAVGADAIRVGESLRNFTAVDENGDTFTSTALAGKPVLMKFFRGHW